MTQFKKQKIQVSIVQTDAVLADVNHNISQHIEQIERAISLKSDIVIFPELSVTGYSLKDAVYEIALTDDDPRLDAIKKLSEKISIIIGLAELDKRFEIYNSLLFFEDGLLKTKHRKVYLPTYGLFEEKRYFSEGKRFRAFDSKFGRFGMLICEDLWHPTSGVILAQDRAAVIFVAAAGIARGIDENSQPENVRVWEALNRSLAISTTSYMVFANRVGVEDGLMFWGGSELIDPSGSMIKKAAYFRQEHLTAAIDFLKLKHTRINTTLLGDEKIDIVIDELNRLKQMRKEY